MRKNTEKSAERIGKRHACSALKRAEVDARLLAIRDALADPNYWPPASSAEEELTFAMLVRSGSFSITGQTPGEIRTDLIRQEKRRRLLRPMHRQTQPQILSKMDRYGENLLAFDIGPQCPSRSADSAVSFHQASLENCDVQSPVCNTYLPSAETACGQSRSEERRVGK